MLVTARAAAIAAGVIQKRHYGQLLNVDARTRNDIKLEVDRLCEAAIINTIAQVYPSHGFLAEERGQENAGSEYRWVIDPLDGTVNYFYGLPYFCTSIACYQQGAGQWDILPGLGKPVLAVVYSVATGDLFYAESGKGAYLNDNPIRVADVTALEDCMVATGFGSTTAGLQRMRGGYFALGDRVCKMRCLGAAALDICNTACGRLTAFFEKGLHHWDVAAGALIAAEAGATVRATEYEPGRWDFLVSAPGVAGVIVEALNASAAEDKC